MKPSFYCMCLFRLQTYHERQSKGKVIHLLVLLIHDGGEQCTLGRYQTVVQQVISILGQCVLHEVVGVTRQREVFLRIVVVAVDTP